MAAGQRMVEVRWPRPAVALGPPRPLMPVPPRRPRHPAPGTRPGLGLCAYPRRWPPAWHMWGNPGDVQISGETSGTTRHRRSRPASRPRIVPGSFPAAGRIPVPVPRRAGWRPRARAGPAVGPLPTASGAAIMRGTPSPPGPAGRGDGALRPAARPTGGTIYLIRGLRPNAGQLG